MNDKNALEGGRISVLGARVHNLKNIDVEIPRNKLTVITGMSGSGKSSLAFDTIFAEGQRRYVETFSAYARNFLGNMERPDVDKITVEPGHLDRTENDQQESPFYCRYDDRDLRLFPSALCEGGRGVLVSERREDGEIHRRAGARPDSGAL